VQGSLGVAHYQLGRDYAAQRGLYSFFQEYYRDCLNTFNCQERIFEVKGSKDIALFNLFTVGTVEVATGIK
jgi:hypothetical protein